MHHVFVWLLTSKILNKQTCKVETKTQLHFGVVWLEVIHHLILNPKCENEPKSTITLEK